MEKFFGVSYPTIKNRLNRIGALLPFAEKSIRNLNPIVPAARRRVCSRSWSAAS